MNQAIYDKAMANGCSERMAELLAARKVNIGLTDKQYFSRFKYLGDELADEHRQQVVRDAKLHGYNASPADVYMPELARFSGDPEAFVSPHEGRAKIRKVMEKRGAVCRRGSLEFSWPTPASDPLAPNPNKPAIADDLIEAGVRDIIAENPDAAKESRKKLRQKVIKERSPRGARTDFE